MGLVDGAAERCRRGIHLPLSQPQLRQTRLRRSSPPARLAVRLLGFRELAAQSMQLGLLIEGRTHPWLARWLGQPLAHASHFIHRVRPCTVQLHDLGTVHQALTTVGHQVWLRRAPLGQCFRPLLRSSEVEDGLTFQDHGAIDDARRNRRYLADRDRDHGLVKQCDAGSDLSAPDQRLALTEPAEGHQVCVAKALADLSRLAEGGVRGRGVTLGKALQRNRHEQVALLYAVTVSIIEQPPGTGEPATATGPLTLEHQPEGQPERTAGGSLGIASAHKRLMRTRPSVGTVDVPAHQMRCQREELKVLRPKRNRAICGRQLGIRIPRPAVRRTPDRDRVRRSWSSIGSPHLELTVEALQRASGTVQRLRPARNPNCERVEEARRDPLP